MVPDHVPQRTASLWRDIPTHRRRPNTLASEPSSFMLCCRLRRALLRPANGFEAKLCGQGPRAEAVRRAGCHVRAANSGARR